MSLLELFYHVDEFCQAHEADWKRQQLASGERQRHRQGYLWLSEIMTIAIHFHQMRFRDFKTYYTHYVQVHLSSEFPHLVSYNRFVERMAETLVPLSAYLQSCYGACTGIAFIDSTPLAVCDNRRIGQHRTFRDLAQRGKNSMGWFYGFKLHVVVNERGELLACRLSAGNVDDRTPVPKLVHRLFGWLYADKGYLSQALVRHLLETYRLYLVTHARTNMKNRLLSLLDRLLLRKRAILETITDQLKNISQIEHSRHRSFTNLCVNLLAGLIAYCHQPKKPALQLDLFPRLDDFIPN